MGITVRVGIGARTYEWSTVYVKMPTTMAIADLFVITFV